MELSTTCAGPGWQLEISGARSKDAIECRP
jgi:hypothetical protein